MDKNWYIVSNASTIPSPALVVYPDRIRANIQRAVTIAGDPQLLRPHVKTHKCRQIIRMHLELGVTKFKCATIAEAEMAADAGAKDVLVAAQLVGPGIQRFGALRRKFPATLFATICDSAEVAKELSALGVSEHEPVRTYLDLNCGMDRTGIIPGEAAIELHRLLGALPGISVAGLHAYDGHIHDADLASREKQFELVNKSLVGFRNTLLEEPLPVPNTVASGTPSFALHARHKDRECSPGTYVFWDFGYQRYIDLDFQLAALVVTRVISKPTPQRLCLDLGHKAVASENPHPRVQFLNLPDGTPVMHSEEHLVLESADAPNWQIGDILYGVPRHICPTVALHDFCYPVVNGVAGEPWPIEARRRKISI